jgi:hypothetical protein
MALSWTTTELLVDVREQARLSDDDPSATDTIILREATRILHSVYVPKVRKARADYYVQEAWIDIEAGRAAYPIPRRATTASVRRVRVSDPDGDNERDLKPASIEDISRNATSTRPTHYALLDDRLVLWPVPTTDDLYTLRVQFEYRPGQLIAEDDAYSPAGYSWDALAPYTTEDSHLFLFDVSPDPPFVDGDMVDVIRKDPPFAVVLMDGVVDVTVSVSDRFVLTSWIGPRERLEVAAAYPRYYVCAAGETPIPQIPAEMHPALALHTAAKIIKPIDPQMANELGLDADRQLQEHLEIMSPRKQGTGLKVRSRSSLARRGRRGGWGGRNTFEDL